MWINDDSKYLMIYGNVTEKKSLTGLAKTTGYKKNMSINAATTPIHICIKPVRKLLLYQPGIVALYG
jgi:hypothetical protein